MDKGSEHGWWYFRPATIRFGEMAGERREEIGFRESMRVVCHDARACVEASLIEGRDVAFIGVEEGDRSRSAYARKATLLNAKVDAPCEQSGAKQEQQQAS